MTEQNQNPGRKRRKVENEGDGNRFFDTFRFTPYTTDLDFFRDPNIYEAEQVARSTQDIHDPRDKREPRGASRPDPEIRDEIHELLGWQKQIDARDIRVEVRTGIVNLSGTVNSSYEQQTAEDLVRNVLGVLGVENHLRKKRP